MLRKNVTRAVRPMLNGMIRRGVGLEALNETPMAELVEFSQPGVTDDEIETIQAAESPVDAVLELVEATSEIGATHGMLVDGLVDQGTAAVARTIEKAREVVMPAIAKIAEAVTASVDRQLTPINDIVSFKIPAVVTSPTINSLFAQYEGGNVDVNIISDLPQFTTEQLSGLLETGSQETNDAILDYLAGLPEGGLEVIIADVIRGAQPEVVGYVNAIRFGAGARSYITRDVNVLPAIVIAAVVLRNLYDNPPAGVNVGIVSWNDEVVKSLAGLAANYHVLLNDIAAHVASGQLYLPSTLRQGTTIASYQFPVLDRMYDKFLDSDGFPEVLFALTLPEQDLRLTMQQALDNKELLSSKWSAYVESFRGSRIEMMNSLARDVIYGEIGELMGTLDMNELAVSTEEMWAAIRESGDHTTFTPDNLYVAIRFLVAGVLFGRYQTLPLLKAMDEHMDANPNCSPRVAAYHGTKAYVCQWVADQLKKVQG